MASRWQCNWPRYQVTCHCQVKIKTDPADWPEHDPLYSRGCQYEPFVIALVHIPCYYPVTHYYCSRLACFSTLYDVPPSLVTFLALYSSLPCTRLFCRVIQCVCVCVILQVHNYQSWCKTSTLHLYPPWAPLYFIFYDVQTPNNHQACYFTLMPCANEPIRAVRRSTCPTVNVATLLEEVFDLNVSGSEEDSAAPAAQPALAHPDPAPPAPANSQSIIPASLGINNTDVQEGRVYASDIHYFFKVTPNEKICKICQLVSLSKMPFQSIGPCWRCLQWSQRKAGSCFSHGF